MKNLASLIVLLAAPLDIAAVAECDCASVESSLLPCWMEDWERVGTRRVRTLADSVDLIGALTDGTSAGEKCWARSEFARTLGCGRRDGECLERCIVECHPVLMRRMCELAAEKENPRIQRGALSMCFSLPPEGASQQLQDLSLGILRRDGDPLTKLIMLQWISYHHVRHPDTMDAILLQLSADDPLVRQISADIFRDYSGHDLPFDRDGPASMRSEQLAAIERWWWEIRPRYVAWFEERSTELEPEEPEDVEEPENPEP
jgi:hypothetical protein